MDTMPHYQRIKTANARRKTVQIRPHIKDCTSILDFGCGDMAFAAELRKTLPETGITGLDVVDFGIRQPGIRYRQYDGKLIPFGSGTFGAVIAWHVFHHTPDPEYYFSECLRVAKKTVIVTEPVYRHPLEIPGMAAMDWMFNVWKSRSISYAFRFHTLDWWKGVIRRYGGKIGCITDVELMPAWSPTGRSYMIVVHKQNKL